MSLHEYKREIVGMAAGLTGGLTAHPHGIEELSAWALPNMTVVAPPMPKHIGRRSRDTTMKVLCIFAWVILRN